MTTITTLTSDLPEGRAKAITWEEYEPRLWSEWQQLLARKPEEREVQSFLELHPCLLPGAFGEVGPGGHHGPQLAGVFREPPLKGLSRTRRPDFMWVTGATRLITPICIEIEKPQRPWFTSEGRPTAHLAASIDQLTDWKVWFAEPDNQSIFRKTYVFDDLDHWALEPQYVLIYGRKAEFAAGKSQHRNPAKLDAKRNFMRREKEIFYTFDSLTPSWKARECTTITMKEDGGPTLFAFPPTYTTGPDVTDEAVILRDPTEALARSAWMTDERKDHIHDRWLHWQREGDRRREPHELVARTLGRGE